MVYIPLLLGKICSITVFVFSIWAVLSIFIGSKISLPIMIFPRYKIPLNSPISKASIGVFISALSFGIGSLGVAFTKETHQNSAFNCDVFIRMCVFSFIMAAGFTYSFLLVKVQTTKIDRSKRSLIEWMLMIGLLGIPVLIICAIIYLPGRFRSSSDGKASVCVVNTEQWGVFLAFSLSDWTFNIGFFILFGISLREIVLSQRNAAGSEYVERAAQLTKVAKRNFIACLFCVIPATVQIGMLLYTATITNTDVAVISEALTNITVCFFIVSVIYSTRKAWKFSKRTSIKSNATNSGTGTRKSNESAENLGNISAATVP